MQFRFDGNTQACDALIGFALKEQFTINNHAKPFGYGVLVRNVKFSDGSSIRTLYLKNDVISFINCPEQVVAGKKVLPTEEIITTTMVRVELIRDGSSVSAFYSTLGGTVSRLSDFSTFEHDYTKYTNYYTTSGNKDRVEECCACVIGSVVNLTIDNVYNLAFSNKDDWHSVCILWVGTPYWFAGTYHLNEFEDTWVHPGLESGISGAGIHWSHSPTTYGSASIRHYQRFIDQEKRVYRPGLINLRKDEDDGSYLMAETAVQPFGKRPYTRSTSNEKLISYNERAKITGSGAYSINDSKYNYVTFFWPFIPYMFDIPYFTIFNYEVNEAIYGRCVTPEQMSSCFKAYGIEKQEIGKIAVTTTTTSTDSASFTGSDNVHTSTADERPHYEWPGPIYVGPEPPSGEWTDTTSDSWSYSGSVTKTVPIGPLNSFGMLEVQTSISVSGAYSGETETVNTKTTEFGAGVYIWPPSYTEMWGEGEWTDNSVINYTEEDLMQCSASITTALRVGGSAIVSGSGTFSFSSNRVYTIENDNTYTWINDTPFWGGWSGHGEGSGTRVDTDTITANMSRSLTSFEVLDYDSDSNHEIDYEKYGAYAIVYKKVELTHTLNRSRSVTSSINTNGAPLTGIISNGGGFCDMSTGPTEEQQTISDVTTPGGSRTVTYILYAKAGGNTYTKTLSTLTTTISAVSGNKINAVVVKLDGKRLIISYDLESFSTAGNSQTGVNYIDSPKNFEDWNYDTAGTKMWTVVNKVVGVVDLSTVENFGAELFENFDPMAEDVYAIGTTEIAQDIKREIKNVE